MGSRADANRGRCIWPWNRPHPTSELWNLSPICDGVSPLVPGLLGQIPMAELIGTGTA